MAIPKTLAMATFFQGLAAPSPGAAAAFSAWTFNDWGDRVVQLLRLPIGEGGSLSILNTHLTFPHPSEHDGPMRRQQARKLAEIVRAIEGGVLCFGDMNGDVSRRAFQPGDAASPFGRCVGVTG